MDPVEGQYIVMAAYGSGQWQVIELIPTSELVCRWREELDIDVTHYFRDIDVIQVLECKHSGMVRFEPSPIGDETLYRALALRNWYYLEDKWEIQLSLRRVRQNSRVLEIGCGRGAFLAKAKQRGASVTGIELNKAAAGIASQRGIDIVHCDVHEVPDEWLGSFDFVMAFQVVEHVSDPLAFCEKLFSLVKPGGDLHIAVPNRDGFIRHFRSQNVLDLPPHHASRWNSRSLKYLGSKIGARSMRIIRSPLEKVHIDWFLTAYRRQLGKLALNRVSTPLARAFLNVGFRHLMVGHTIVGIYGR